MSKYLQRILSNCVPRTGTGLLSDKFNEYLTWRNNAREADQPVNNINTKPHTSTSHWSECKKDVSTKNKPKSGVKTVDVLLQQVNLFRCDKLKTKLCKTPSEADLRLPMKRTVKRSVYACQGSVSMIHQKNA